MPSGDGRRPRRSCRSRSPATPRTFVDRPRRGSAVVPRYRRSRPGRRARSPVQRQGRRVGGRRRRWARRSRRWRAAAIDGAVVSTVIGERPGGAVAGGVPGRERRGVAPVGAPARRRRWSRPRSTPRTRRRRLTDRTAPRPRRWSRRSSSASRRVAASASRTASRYPSPLGERSARGRGRGAHGGRRGVDGHGVGRRPAPRSRAARTGAVYVLAAGRADELEHVPAVGDARRRRPSRSSPRSASPAASAGTATDPTSAPVGCVDLERERVERDACWSSAAGARPAEPSPLGENARAARPRPRRTQRRRPAPEVEADEPGVDAGACSGRGTPTTWVTVDERAAIQTPRSTNADRAPRA